MSTTPSLEELMRAATAAGYAMAAMDDEPAVASVTTTETVSVSVEDSARGARRPVTAAEFVAAGPDRSVVASASGVRSSATAVRDTVYGYLRMGVPA
jgi:hypothetical protein